MKNVIHTHYTRLAKNYDDFLYYSPDFVRSLTKKMIEKLQLQEDDQMADIGCGTGMYSLDILKQVSLKKPIICVDPFQGMLDGISKEAPITRICMDALSFSRQPGSYDKILIKETIHHVTEKKEFFLNLYQRLNPNGILLLVHVPPKVQYPLFQTALARCENWHADPDDLERGMKEGGFQVERDILDFPHSIPKEKYFKMVEGCYMSVLTSFEEEEIQEGLKEMEETYKDQSTLKFIDHFDYITGEKV
jgi:ubiquinone/menaquinone biosynthesis C-methylase UbiE